MKFFTPLFCFLNFIQLTCNSQDPTFSQYDYNPLYYNPALTGLLPNGNPGLRINCVYRSLWTNIPSSFTTYSFSADLESPCIKSGQGIIAMNDVEGEGKLRTSKIGGLYSYRITIEDKANRDKLIIQVGTEVDFVQKRVDWDRLVFSDQVDSLNGISLPTGNVHPNQETSSYADFHYGVVGRLYFPYRYNQPTTALTIGFAIHHLTQPNESILGLNSKLPRKLTVHGSWAFNIYSGRGSRSSFVIGPSFMWEIQDVNSSFTTDFVRPFQTYNIGFAISMLPLYASLAYRNKTPLLADMRHADALIVHVALSMNNNKENPKLLYRIGYSYDLTLSKLSPSTAGTQEISLQIIFPNANPICSALGMEEKNNRKKFRCPSF